MKNNQDSMECQHGVFFRGSIHDGSNERHKMTAENIRLYRPAGFACMTYQLRNGNSGSWYDFCFMKMYDIQLGKLRYKYSLEVQLLNASKKYGLEDDETAETAWVPW